MLSHPVYTAAGGSYQYPIYRIIPQVKYHHNNIWPQPMPSSSLLTMMMITMIVIIAKVVMIMAMPNPGCN